MSDLPRGWEWATLGDLAESVQNGIFVSRPGVEPNGVPILRISSVRPMQLDLQDLRYTGMDSEVLAKGGKLLRGGDLLFTRYSGSRELVGACARMPSRSIALTYPDKLIRVRVGSIDSRYLELAFASPIIRRKVESSLRTTAGQVGISGASLKSISVPIAPIGEQRRIVDVLDDLLSRVGLGKSSLDSASLRATKFEGRVATVSQLWRPEGAGSDSDVSLPPVGTHDGALPSLPQRWRWVRLGEIADVVGGITKDGKRQNDEGLREVSYLRVANVQRGHLDLSEVAAIRAPGRRIAELALQPGDVLLNEGGDRDKLARGWIWQSELPLCIHQNHVFRARIRDGVLDPRILAWHANTFGKRWAQDNGKQSVNLASISLKMIRLMPVPVPPVSEQPAIVEEIEAQLASAARMRASIAVTRHRAEQLRRSLLTEAFAGRLLPQDPTNEPASVLLARIRAERAAAPKPRRTRKPTP